MKYKLTMTIDFAATDDVSARAAALAILAQLEKMRGYSPSFKLQQIERNCTPRQIKIATGLTT